LGAPEELFQDGSINNFPREFRLGMAADDPDPEGRSRRLGDIGENAPSNWEWGAPPETPDVLVMLYAEAGCLAAFQQMVMADLALGFESFVLGTAKAAERRRRRGRLARRWNKPAEIDWGAKLTEPVPISTMAI
jgi:hypothetical protein